MSEPVRTTFAKLIEQKILEIGDGYRAKLDELGGDGPIFLRAGLVTEKGIVWNGGERFRPDIIETVNSKLGRPGDTMVTTKGNSIGRAGYVPEGSPLFVYSPHLSYWRSSNSTLLVPGYLRYWAHSPEFIGQLRAMAGSTDMAPYLSLSDQRRLLMTLPEPLDQQAIAALLGALDDKIAVNDRIAETERKLARARFRAARESQDPEDVDLASIVEFLNRGVGPRYTENQSQLRVLNQKCVRDGRVNLAPSRWTLTDKVPSGKMLRTHDVLVNSTGVGTLGRVARWTREEACTVDSHITIVRFDPAKVDPVCAGFAMLDAEAEIESLGQGSTGQTELGRTQLSGLRIKIPSGERALQLRPSLDALENRADSAMKESLSLAELRDTLLPKLMSGEIRVREAEKVVEDVT